MAGCGRQPPIASHNLIVRFLRNGNHSPDSGPSRAALQKAVPDPERPFAQTFIMIGLLRSTIDPQELDRQGVLPI